MNDPIHQVRLTFGDSLSYGLLREVRYVLASGGFCVLPSDTCYSLAAIPTRWDAMAKIAHLLPEKRQDPIPLSFGSLQLVERFVELRGPDLRLIDELCPGPLTLVCKMREKVLDQKLSVTLHTSGTLGVRIPDSPVERQISIEMDGPITTCAIRDDAGEAIRDFDLAVDVVKTRLQAEDMHEHFVAVRMSRIRYSDHSTVVEVDMNAAPACAVHVFRPGAIEPRVIEDTLRRVSFRDTEDWT